MGNRHDTLPMAPEGACAYEVKSPATSKLSHCGKPADYRVVNALRMETCMCICTEHVQCPDIQKALTGTLQVYGLVKLYHPEPEVEVESSRAEGEVGV